LSAAKVARARRAVSRHLMSLEQMGKYMSNYQPLDNANYGSIADFLAAAGMPCRVIRNQAQQTYFTTRPSYDADWYGAGCKTGNDVRKLVNDGWPQGRERLNTLRNQISVIDAVPVDKRRRLVRGASGDSLDMPYVWSGRLDIAWRSAKRTDSRGPQRIEIVANMICSGGEHADVLFWRGAAAVVLADILEAAGYMVRLTVNFGGKAEESKVSCRIVVKDHGTPLDITSTSAVILPGFFRAIGHAWIAAHCPHARDQGGIMVGQGMVEPGEVLVSHSVRDHGTALALVNDTIASINSGTLAAA
jgi:hypothetical protein